MKYGIGIDVGGMSIKFGLVDEEGNIEERARVVTPKDVGVAVREIVRTVNDILSGRGLTVSDIKGIGIGCPGAVDSVSGKIVCLPNLGWENFCLADELKKYFNTQIKLSNDVNVAALGEAKYGAAKEFDSSVMIAVGTGVGSGIILDKKLYEGGKSRGAEIGHTTLVFNGLECTCGRRGCVECYASATALIAQTKAEMNENKKSKMWEYVNGDINGVDGRTAFECSKLGDESAEKVVNAFISYLGECLLNVCNVFRTDAIIIGGGISAQGNYLTDKLQKYCEKFDYGYKNAPRTKIMVAKLGNDAGIVGAASLVD